MIKGKAEFLNHLAELVNINGLMALCAWDLETYMPKGAIETKSRHTEFLETLYYKKIIDKKFGGMIEEMSAQKTDDLKWDALIREVKRERDRFVKLPQKLVEELSSAKTRALLSWRKSKEENNFEYFKEDFGRVLELTKQKADAIGYKTCRYDALLDEYEPKSTASQLVTLFSSLKKEVITLLGKIESSKIKSNRKVLEGKFPLDKQEKLIEYILRKMGYDFNIGRVDKSTHPFTTSFGPGDVRITVRVKENNFASAFFAAMHEGGHGIYDQNLFKTGLHEIISQAPSFGLHESQSRFWENIIGRSLPFWRANFKYLIELFPNTFENVSLNEFYRAINHVERSCIRIEADELTYSLHIILRFEIEYDLFENKISIDDLEDAWNQKMREYLGIKPKTLSEGFLQDIHWAGGSFSYFPSYTLGNIYSANFLDKMSKDVPDMWKLVEKGELAFIKEWLIENIYKSGRIYSATELVKRVTGHEPSSTYYVNYLTEKYKNVYNF